MATIFDREFRREKNLEMAKRQAEMKKPAKRDNTIVDKKQEKLNAYLNELEETFFKDVSKDDPESLATIKQRGEVVHEQKVPVAKEEAKVPKQEEKKAVPKVVKTQLPVGEYMFKGTATKGVEN